MRTNLALAIVLLYSFINESIAQKDSPIGEWVITEHLVIYYDSTDSTWNERNVLPDEFESNIFFKQSGEFEYQLEDTTYKGNWKLSKTRKKLTINVGSINYKSRRKEPHNFEGPFRYPTSLKQFYHTQNDTLFGGTSIYLRVAGEEPSIDTTLLIGKWLVTHIQVGNKKVEYKKNWTIEYHSDGTYTEGKHSGKWKLNGFQLTLDPEDSANSQSMPHTSRIEFTSDIEYHYSGKEGRFRKATIFWKKID